MERRPSFRCPLETSRGRGHRSQTFTETVPSRSKSSWDSAAFNVIMDSVAHNATTIGFASNVARHRWTVEPPQPGLVCHTTARSRSSIVSRALRVRLLLRLVRSHRTNQRESGAPGPPRTGTVHSETGRGARRMLRRRGDDPVKELIRLLLCRRHVGISDRQAEQSSRLVVHPVPNTGRHARRAARCLAVSPTCFIPNGPDSSYTTLVARGYIPIAALERAKRPSPRDPTVQHRLIPRCRTQRPRSAPSPQRPASVMQDAASTRIGGPVPGTGLRAALGLALLRDRDLGRDIISGYLARRRSIQPARSGTSFPPVSS